MHSRTLTPSCRHAIAVNQVVGQLDILAQTVALLEQRLSLSEDRNGRLEAIYKQALNQHIAPSA